MEQISTEPHFQENTVSSVPSLLRESQEILDKKFFIFENEIPPFVESFLEKLYSNLFSSVKKFGIYGNLEGVSTYVAQQEREVTAVFLFKVIGKRIHVLNELIEVEKSDVHQFVEYAFSQYNVVNVISFSAIQTAKYWLPFPVQRLNCSENTVLSLPESVDKYLASLGNSSRRDIKYKINKIRKDFPSFETHFYEKGDVSEHHVTEIFRLKHARFAEKNKVVSINEEEIKKIFRLVKECNGLVCIATIDGSICGGVINYRVGSNYFMTTISHDPRYNRHSLGMICCYLTICETILRKGKEFHFLWGREDYKYRLLGMQRDLYNLNIYRSPLKLLTNFNVAIPDVCKASIRTVKLWLLNPMNRQKIVPRIALKSAKYMRDVKKMKDQFRQNT